MSKPKAADPAAVIVIILTVVLFLVALVMKDFTHEILLEAGVFLVSTKLILMARKNAETEYRLEQQLVSGNYSELLVAF